jgi:hypothetical protein
MATKDNWDPAGPCQVLHVPRGRDPRPRAVRSVVRPFRSIQGDDDGPTGWRGLNPPKRRVR